MTQHCGYYYFLGTYSEIVVGSAIADHAGHLMLQFPAVVRNSGPYQQAKFR